MPVFHTCMLFLTDVTEMLLHTDALTHRNGSQSLLHRDDFTLSNFTHRCRNKQRCFYKGMDYARSFYFNMTSDGGRAFDAKEFNMLMQDCNFTTEFDDRGALRGKGLAKHKPIRVA